jgi:hypothetical protein
MKLSTILEDLNQKQIVNEAALSRTWKMMKDHDSGCLTAFRGYKMEGDEFILDDKGEKIPLSHATNKARNKQLLAKILKDFSVTTVQGTYIENYGEDDAEEHNEETFLVVDHKGRGDLKQKLIQWGEEFEQDSVLFVAKGGEKGTLIGTNKVADFPGLGNEVSVAHPVFGNSGMFMTRIHGRPFTFTESLNTFPQPCELNYLSRMAMDRIANSPIIKE